MSMEVIFPFLRDEREQIEKRRLDFLKGLLKVMEIYDVKMKEGEVK